MNNQKIKKESRQYDQQKKVEMYLSRTNWVGPILKDRTNGIKCIKTDIRNTEIISNTLQDEFSELAKLFTLLLIKMLE